MSIYKNILLSTLGVVFATVAHAQVPQGPYVNLGAGVNFLQDQNLRAPLSSGLAGVGRTNTGWMGSTAVGWSFGNGFRVELQGDYRQNTLHNMGALHAGGQQEQFGGFVNGLYDFTDLNLGLPITPYAGIGLGYQQVKFSNARAYGTLPASGVNYMRTGSTDGDFAVQGILGASYDITSVPGLALTAEYRFSAIPGGLNFKGQQYQSGTEKRVDFSSDNGYSHAALLGVRWSFGSTPAPAAVTTQFSPGPAREAARTYLVFFDWDRSDLSQRARQVVQEAAAASRNTQVTRIGVSGHTDTSGTPAYNQKLSERRAQAVANELVRDGVDRSVISVVGYGEGRLLVSTGNGVREPQNRRVEIVLQ